MAKKRRRISDGATLEEVQALLLKCTRQLRALTPAGADLSGLDRIEAEQACLSWLQQTQPINSKSIVSLTHPSNAL
jgi:hypothetical protein